MTPTLTPLASLADVEAHPLCTVTHITDPDEDSPYRFHFENSVAYDFACDDDVLSMAALFISDGLPFTLTVTYR
jgi:hypothetical protein